MKNIFKFSMAVGALLVAQPTQAGCPTLSSKELGQVLCPGVGALSKWTINSVDYTRKVDVLGTASNLCSFITKSARSEEKDYKGIESDVKPGTLVCNYELKEGWKKEAGIDEFTMSTAITSPVAKRAALCPALTYSELATALCGTSFQIGNTEWSTPTKGTKDAVCKFGKGLWAGIKGAVSSAPEGSIYGQIGEGTTQFQHKCTYTYHRANKPTNVVLSGKMDLKRLSSANLSVIEHMNEENIR